jgi:hypothetical protein
VRAKYFPRVAQQDLTMPWKLQRPGIRLKKAVPRQFFKPLQLKRDCRLSAAEPFGHLGKIPLFDEENEASQKRKCYVKFHRRA